MGRQCESDSLIKSQAEVEDFCSWGKNVLKKALNLDVPYFVFSFATWLLKTVFSSSVNSEIGGLFDTLFLHPTSPYWYLYALFFIFLITPTFRNKTIAVVGLAIAVVLKTLGIIGGVRYTSDIVHSVKRDLVCYRYVLEYSWR